MSHHDTHGSHQPHDPADEAQPDAVRPGTTQPGGGREDQLADGGTVRPDPSHPSDPVDGAPSPGPQPGATDPSRPAADEPTP